MKKKQQQTIRVVMLMLEKNATYPIPAGPRLHHLVGRLARPHHERTLQPDVARVQRVHTVPGVHLLTANEAERWRIGRIDALELEQMPLQRIQRMVLELADRGGQWLARRQLVQFQVLGARGKGGTRPIAPQCGGQPAGVDALAPRRRVPVGAVAGGHVAHGTIVVPGEHVADGFGEGGLRKEMNIIINNM